MRTLLGLLLAGTLLAGCGYRPEGSLAADGVAPRLFVALAANKTGRAFLENELSNKLVERFARSGRFRVSEERAAADVLFAAEILTFASPAVAYDRHDVIRLYRVEITVAGTLTDNATGRILWKGSVQERAEYAADPDRAVQQANENAALVRLCELLADDLYARTVDDF